MLEEHRPALLESLPEFLSMSVMGTSAGVWVAFVTLVLVILTLDLGVLNRKDHEIGMKESLWYSLGYITLACVFGVWVWNTRGSEDGMNYFTAYLVEQSLSLDNLFVMSVIFAYFGIPRIYQHRVLFWGIIGVIVMRGILIGFGTAVVHQFEEVLLLFAAFLIFTGIKMMRSDDDGPGIEDSKLLKFLQRHMNVTPFMRGHAFFIRDKGTGQEKAKLQATPLFLALVTIELADLIFAVDSVPAVLSITSDTFVVYTSNIFAVLGLRTMYFAVAAVIHRFEYMKYALSIILIFIGLKAFYVQITDEKIPAFVSLGITLSLLIGGFIYSLLKTRSNERLVVQNHAKSLAAQDDTQQDAEKPQ
jgi:tellurite resistance protein TerC